jgi:hypothetical protein
MHDERYSRSFLSVPSEKTAVGIRPEMTPSHDPTRREWFRIAAA